MLFIGVEVEQETSAPPPKKKPGSAPVCGLRENISEVKMKRYRAKLPYGNVREHRVSRTGKYTFPSKEIIF